MYNWGKRSLKVRSELHPDLQKLADEALRRSVYLGIDWGLHQGYRSPEDQKKAFDAGYSQIDGYTRKSKHNYEPARAFDFHVYFHNRPDLTWDEFYMTAVALLIKQTAKELYEQGKMKHRIRWGGDWDSDLTIKKDQTLWDPGHIELIM